MPRDPSGNYTLPALGNPAVTGTPITIAWWNGTGTDLAAAMTDSLSRSGNGGMLGPFQAVDGSAGAPGYTFQSETTSGLYRFGPGELDVTVGGTRLSRWTAAGFQESFDNGATWKNPLYNNNGDQTFTGGLDFTAGKLTVGGLVVDSKPTFSASSSTGTFSTTSTSFTAVTNASVTFTARGGLVMIQLSADFTSNPAAIFSFPSSGTTTPILTSLVLALSDDGGSTFKALQSYTGVALYGLTYTATAFPVSGYIGWFTPSVGSATFSLYIKTFANTTARVDNCKLTYIQF